MKDGKDNCPSEKAIEDFIRELLRLYNKYKKGKK